MRDQISVTKPDFEKLQWLIEGWRSRGAPDSEYLERLEQELERAEVVEADAIPPDVVTMNSLVRLKDLDSGAVTDYRLVFPFQSRPENGVSVLAPVGAAMLGYRAGDVVEWRVPRGIRRLQVVKVLYQPEAAGASDR